MEKRLILRMLGFVLVVFIAVLVILFLFWIETLPDPPEKICIAEEKVCYNIFCAGAMPHACFDDEVSCDGEYEREYMRCIKYKELK